MKTNFEKVSELNTAFGNFKGSPHTPNWGRLKSQWENIKDEYEEGLEAIAAGDMTAFRDAIQDVLTFCYGAAHIAGVDADEDMNHVHSSNLSKFIANEEELEATKQKYDALGVEYYQSGDFPYMCLKSSKEQLDKDGKNYPNNKFLKGVGFKEPVFKDVA